METENWQTVSQLPHFNSQTFPLNLLLPQRKRKEIAASFVGTSGEEVPMQTFQSVSSHALQKRYMPKPRKYTKCWQIVLDTMNIFLGTGRLRYSRPPNLIFSLFASQAVFIGCDRIWAFGRTPSCTIREPKITSLASCTQKPGGILQAPTKAAVRLRPGIPSTGCSHRNGRQDRKPRIPGVQRHGQVWFSWRIHRVIHRSALVEQ